MSRNRGRTPVDEDDDDDELGDVDDGSWHPDEASAEDYARRELREIHQDLAKARSRGPASSIPLLRRAARAARSALEEVLAAKAAGVGADPTEGMTDDELVAAQIEAMQELPEHLLEPLAYALIDRLGLHWFAHHCAKRVAERDLEVEDLDDDE